MSVSLPHHCTALHWTSHKYYNVKVCVQCNICVQCSAVQWIVQKTCCVKWGIWSVYSDIFAVESFKYYFAAGIRTLFSFFIDLKYSWNHKNQNIKIMRRRKKKLLNSEDFNIVLFLVGCKILNSNYNCRHWHANTRNTQQWKVVP